jgi:uncharacterized protein (DUF2147 family)
MKLAARLMVLLLATAVLLSGGSQVTGDPPAADPAKKDKDAKPAKDEPQYNPPPRGATVVALGKYRGQITKGSDGKAFSMDVVLNGKKQEIEINLAAYTKVYRVQQSDFDEKGNPKKTAPVATAATADDLRGGRTVIVNVSGTRDGKWVVAKTATLVGD